MQDVRLFIGIPTNKEYCLYQFFINFIRMWRPPQCTTFIYNGQPVSKSRNIIVKSAFDWGATHLLFLDDDMTFPENTLKILLEQNKDIIGSLAFKRKEPYLPVIYKKNPANPDRFITITDYEKGIIPVEATGAAFLLVKMDVFRRLKFPWFDFAPDEDHPGELIGEDLYFCKKAKEAGYSIWVDTVHTIGHIGTVEVGESVWKGCRKHKFGEDSKLEFDSLGNIIPSAEKILIE